MHITGQSQRIYSYESRKQSCVPAEATLDMDRIPDRITELLKVYKKYQDHKKLGHGRHEQKPDGKWELM